MGTLFCWSAAVVHLYRFIAGGRGLASASLLAAFVFKAITFSLAVPECYAFVDRLLRTPNISRLILCSCAGAAWAGATLIALSHWSRTPSRSIRGYGIWAAVMIAAQTVLWLLCSPQELDTGFPIPDARHLTETAFLTLHDLVLAFGLIQVIQRCREVFALPVQPWLRTGLRLTIVGSWIYLVFCTLRLASIVLIHTSVDVRPLQLFTPLVTTTAAVLMTVGLTLPAWRTTTSELRMYVRHYRRYRAMRTLWTDLRAFDDMIMLTPSGVTFGSIGFRTYRRAVEIHDGILKVAPQALKAHARQDKSFAEGIRRTAVVVHARLHGDSTRAAVHDQATPSFESDRGEPIHVELDWLAEVGREYSKIRDAALSRSV
ncbi:hypothetical protein GPX89_29350 [Nocardia sp. ET3-3]|uniref:DUF6545 domain-containing protein n=1 Tax=Nocardia terrae TaxID=2675851 RepID=A0A7K1V400_9NOCA|nr:MAB_1171c family putative transporter [Nocardia terrae]MVU81336.1 hypothetical protein [Nocardia terrae]